MLAYRLHFLAFLSKVARRGGDFRLAEVSFEPDLRIVFAAGDPRLARDAVRELNAGDLDPAALRSFRVPAAEAAARLTALGIPARPLPEETTLWEYRGALYPFDAPPPERVGAPPVPDLDGPLPLFLDPAETRVGYVVRRRAGRAPLHTEGDAAGELYLATADGPVLRGTGAALFDRLETAVREIYAKAGFEEFRPFASGGSDPSAWLAGRLPLPLASLPFRFVRMETERRHAPTEEGFGLYASPVDRVDRGTAVCDLAQAPLLCGEIFAMARELVDRFRLRCAVAASAPREGGDEVGLLSAARVMARAHGFAVTGEEPGERGGIVFRLLDPAGRPFAGPALLFERRSALRHLDRAGRERPSVECRFTLTGGLLRLLAAAVEGGAPPLAPLPGGRA